MNYNILSDCLIYLSSCIIFEMHMCKWFNLCEKNQTAWLCVLYHLFVIDTEQKIFNQYFVLFIYE